jgi:hypothetical protein|tara:strand:+ start:202 stop:309 length:108 start_codon:yes stop_codon:yes gene_type:complete
MKIEKLYYDLETKIRNKPAKHILALYILIAIAIIL